jgi:cytidine deaminase
VVSLGTNEVPKAGGGSYWTGEDCDQRDFRRGHDSSDKMKRILLGDILKHLAEAKWLKEEYSDQVPSALVAICLDGPHALMKRAEFTRTIDFVRAVHAEMAALLAAARQGVSTQGCVLYTTTFPCHDCAKHMVAAGVIRVVYVEPYPKSLVQELCSDSMTFDDEQGSKKVQVGQFVGVTPVRYLDLFAVGERKRKSEQGDTVSWDPSTAEPYQPGGIFSTDWVWSKEATESKAFIDLLISKGLVRHEQ